MPDADFAGFPTSHGLTAALALGGLFLWYAIKIYVDYSDRLAQGTFRYSIAHLSLLFVALRADHYWRVPI